MSGAPDPAESVFPQLHCDCADCIERRSKWERAAGFVVRRTCERYSRNHGGVYKINCDICGRGPCQHNAYKDARAVPNRLYGATINHEGDAV